MIPSLSTRLQQRRKRPHDSSNCWRVSSELPVSLQALAACDAQIEQAPVPAAVEPAPSIAGVIDAAPARAAVSVGRAASAGRPGAVGRPLPLTTAAPAAIAVPRPRPAGEPPSEAIALVVWLLLVLIDGALSLRSLLRSPAAAAGAAHLGRRAAGGARPAVSPRRSLLAVIAANQPAVAIS